MKIRSLTLGTSFLVACISSIGFKEAKFQQWESLFNGKNLNGWEQLGGVAKFEVKDKTIVGTTVLKTPNSFLRTKKEYANFILEAEVKSDPLLNTGIQFRSHSLPDYENGRVHGYQLEVDEAVGGFSGRIWDEARRRKWLDTLTDTTGVASAYRVGEWNRLRVTAIGSKIKTEVNDVTVAQITDTLSTRGFIALQVHGSRIPGLQVQFRNIRIKSLD